MIILEDILNNPSRAYDLSLELTRDNPQFDYDIRKAAALQKNVFGNYKSIRSKASRISNGKIIKNSIEEWLKRNRSAHTNQDLKRLKELIRERIISLLTGILGNQIIMDLLSNSLAPGKIVEASKEEDMKKGVDFWMSGIPVQVKTTTNPSDINPLNLGQSFRNKFSRDLEKQRKAGIFRNVCILIFLEDNGKEIGKTKHISYWINGSEPSTLSIDDMGNSEKSKKIINDFFRNCLEKGFHL